MYRTNLVIMLAALVAGAASAYAQAQKSALPAGVTGGVVVASEPGKAAVMATIEVTASITAIDKATRMVTLKGPQGRLVELPVQNKDQFKVVKKGDQVEVVHTEAVALAVTPAAAKPANAKQ